MLRSDAQWAVSRASCLRCRQCTFTHLVPARLHARRVMHARSPGGYSRAPQSVHTAAIDTHGARCKQSTHATCTPQRSHAPFSRSGRESERPSAAAAQASPNAAHVAAHVSACVRSLELRNYGRDGRAHRRSGRACRARQRATTAPHSAARPHPRASANALRSANGQERQRRAARVPRRRRSADHKCDRDTWQCGVLEIARASYAT
jgi:hypothetical protein